MDTYSIFTDGGARGNPGPASCAFIVKDTHNQTVHEDSQYLGETTNNVAEYHGLLTALTWLQQQTTLPAQINIHMDSLLVVSQLKGQYKVKDSKMLSLFQQAKQIQSDLSSRQTHLTFTHIPRNQNSRADELVNQCLDKAARERLS